MDTTTGAEVKTRRPRLRRHGAEVTADQLRAALDRWPDGFDGEERDAIGRIIFALERIAGEL